MSQESAPSVSSASLAVIRPYTDALVEVIGLANPALFGRTLRIQRHAEFVAAQLQIPDAWEVEIAAAFSQVGYLILSPTAVKRAFFGEDLEGPDKILADRIPDILGHLVGGIPGMQSVKKILRYKDKGFSGKGFPDDDVKGRDLPIGARILKVLSDYEAEEAGGKTSQEALHAMRRRLSWYDPEVFRAFTQVLGSLATEERLLGFSDMRPGMVFAEDVKSEGGMLLLAKGFVATASVLDRLRSYDGVVEPVRMRIPIMR